MKQVIGVAFPHADLDGPRADELELRFLQLAYAVERLAQGGADVRGYFLVLRQEIRDRVLQLKAGFEVDDRVRVVFASLLVSEVTALAEAADAARQAGDADAAAGVGRAISLNALRREIAAREPEVTEVEGPDAGPFGVAWDYRGVDRSAAQ